MKRSSSFSKVSTLFLKVHFIFSHWAKKFTSGGKKFREIEFHEFFHLVLLSVFSQLLVLAHLVRLEFVFQNRNKYLGFHLILNDRQYFFPGRRVVLICPVIIQREKTE